MIVRVFRARIHAGENWQNPVIDPDQVHLLQETFLQHYECVTA